MELEEFKNIWKRQEGDRNFEYSQSELLMLINNKMISFEKNIRSRDRREIFTGVFVIVLFTLILFTTDSAWERAGSFVIILSSLFIWYKLKGTQRDTFGQDISPDLPIKEHLKHELLILEKQKKLLVNIVWWYVLPISAGLLMFAMEFTSAFMLKYIYMGIVVLLGAGIWKLNQNAVAQRFDPLIQEIKHSIEFYSHK